MRVTLDAINKRFGDTVAVDDLSLTIEDGEFLVLVGPSGCGKTTSLRMIAGLEEPTDGRIYFGDRDVTGDSPQEREIAFVFQDYALYPHMTAKRNLSFALEDEGVPEDEIERRVEETATMLGIDEQLDQRPGELSGGQQQRVALGRSIIRDPKVFLLDEPLSNLDAKLRMKMRAELQSLHQNLETTMIYVTHDQEEAMTMSDRIAIMNKGTLQQVAPPEVAYNQPANRFVAGFIGSPSMNFLDATLRNGRIVADPFAFESPLDSEDVTELGVRPEDLTVDYDPSDAQASATVEVFEQVGSSNIVYLQVDGHEESVVAETSASMKLEPGDTVGVSVDTERVHLFDRTGDAIYNPPLYERAPEASV
ncbi:ABC transporter ATP-binding protein [Halopelagius longus]|uniref:ABC-type D-xylose/L-arabinose transporter n=1 Tax=Halopelagius longus TaxID=1236180 RepID=A0A1H1G4K2_9EURY|nr:ABC transporter ATP-binding protein [Halopelagius longus]RDI69845.1 ABC transporter ATP-binding protein [Halopelagius longus]SDR08177.1 carbohydrate ABC transporter ATP-binding protein, CUT1 family [Halopelagius longus]